MRIDLSPLEPSSPRDQWVVSAWAASADGEHRQPIILHQGRDRQKACQRYFEALLSSDSFLLKNALEASFERRSQESDPDQLAQEPFGWLQEWPLDYFDQAARTELKDPKLAYFDLRGEQFVARAELSEDEARLREGLLFDNRIWLRGGDGALMSLQASVALLFEPALEAQSRGAGSARI